MSFEGTDLLALDVHTDDPEPFYEWLREECPLYYDENNEMWAVSRYEDVCYVSKHPELFCNSQGVVPGVPLDLWPDDAMINKDGDAHTRQRKLVSKGFSPRRIAEMGDTIRQITTDLIDAVAPKGEADLVRDVARPLPMLIIGDMLGYPRERVEEVLEWTDVYTHAGCGPAHITEEVQDAFANFCEFHEEQLEDRKANPGNDLISVWLRAEIDGEGLSEDTIMFEHNLLLVGGSETTRNAISMGMVELMRNPDQQEWLVDNLDNADAIETAMEEMIRWATPFVRMKRTLTQDVELHGKTMKAGDELVMLYPAASKDPRAYERPQEFDIRRKPKAAPLAFGYGAHFCLGASLARMEARTAIELLLRKLPDMHLQEGNPPVQRPSSFIRGYVTVPIAFTPVR